MPVTSRIVDVAAVTPSDIERWHDLADDAAEPNVFFDPDFLVPSQRHFAGLGRIQLLVVEEGPRWVALLAFEMVPGDRWWPLRHASTAGPILYEYTSLGTPLVANDHPDAHVDALVHALHEHRASLGFAVVVHLLSTGLVGARLAAELADAGHVHQWRDDARGGADLTTPDGSTPRRTPALVRRIKRLAKAHGVTPADVALVDVAPDPDAYLAFEMASWKGTREDGPAFGRGAETSAWFREIITRLATRGQARHLVLRVGDATTYMATCLTSGSTAFGWYDAYAPGDAAASPGAIGRRLTIEKLSADPALTLLDTCMDPAGYPEQTAQYSGRVPVVSLTASLGPGVLDWGLRAREATGPRLRGSVASARRASRTAATQVGTSARRLQQGARGRVRGQKAALTDALRWRLGFYDEHVLPPVPAQGIVLSTVRLRRYTADDCAGRLELEASAGMNLWDENFTAARTADDYTAWFSRIDGRMARGRGPYSFAVEERSSGDYLGDVTVWRLRDQRATAEFGIALLPAARGRGVGREILVGTIDWLFDSGAFRRIAFHHVVENVASCGLVLGAGIPIEGRVPRAFEMQEPGAGSTWHDLCQHGIDIDSYRAARSGAGGASADVQDAGAAGSDGRGPADMDLSTRAVNSGTETS